MLDSNRACISYCVNAGPPQSLYMYILLCERVFPCWTPTVACISCVIVCFHAGLPRSLYPIVLMLDPHRACIASCVNVCFMLDSHGRLYILCDCVFPCWTPTEHDRMVSYHIMRRAASGVISTDYPIYPCRQQKFKEMNGAHLASPIRGELGYAHWPQLGTQFIAILGTKFGAHYGNKMLALILP